MGIFFENPNVMVKRVVGISDIRTLSQPIQIQDLSIKGVRGVYVWLGCKSASA